MSKILELIKTHFGEDSFTPNELSMTTKIDTKVCAMVCKKLSDNFHLRYYRSSNTYHLLDDETRKNEIDKYNQFIDKYNLKNKKIII